MDTDPSGAALAEGPERENLLVQGVGLQVQPAVLEVTVPVSTSADVLSARLRWVGRGSSPTGDSTIRINGHERTGTLLTSIEAGGEAPWVFIYEYDASSLIRPGFNRLFVSGFDLAAPSRSDGIGIMVLYRDSSSPWTSIHIVDPQEFVSAGVGGVWEFPIGTSRDPRNARLVMFAGDCTRSSTDRVWWSSASDPAPSNLAGNAPNVLTNRLGESQGLWMDVLSESVTIPARASHFAYQIESPADGTGDSIVHFFGALCSDGEASYCSGAISGYLWQDIDRDAQQEEGEPGIPDVLVHLSDDLGTHVATTSSDATGFFSFALLCAGEYTVKVEESSLPAGLEPTTCDVGDCSPHPVFLAGDDSESTRLAFGWAEPAAPDVGCFFGPGFWKHQFQVSSATHRGHQHIGTEQLDSLLAEVQRTTALDWTGGDGSLELHDAHAVLSRVSSSSCDKAETHYFVCLLNYAFNGAHRGMAVDTDQDAVTDATFGQVIETVEALLANGSTSDCHVAKGIVDAVNAMPSEECPF